MEVSNRIQLLRKSMNMSQEELGEKMFVSRQTVSQWENGQTMPSIESLLKLREIFGVSVDEILGVATDEAGGEEKEKNEPEESYTFKYDAQEVKWILSHEARQNRNRLIISLALAVISFIAVLSCGSYVMAVLLGLFAVGTFAFASAMIGDIRASKAVIEQIPKKTYEYSVAGEALTVKITENGSPVSLENIPMEAIERIVDMENFYVLVIANRSYIIRKEGLKSNSKLLLYIKAHSTVVVVPSSNMKKWKVIGVAAIIASVLSMFGGLILAAYMAAASAEISNFTQTMWAMFLLLPIPVFTIVVAVILKKKGMNFKKQLIVGIVVCIMLCAFGSSSFIFSDLNEAIAIVQNEMNIYIPEYADYNLTNSVLQKNDSAFSGVMLCTITFSDEESYTFSDSLDERWLGKLPNELNGISAVETEAYQADACLIYNTDTKEYNAVPQASGEYNMILLLYSRSQNSLYIFQYRLRT